MRNPEGCKTVAAGAAEFHGKPYEGGDLYADTWVATDGAGRVMPGFNERGPVKADKWVGIFYWTWHTPNRGGPNDNTRLIGMEIGVARGLIGQTGKIPAFDFHWADNIQRLGEVSEFGLNGDSAPDRRWNYRFETRERSSAEALGR